MWVRLEEILGLLKLKPTATNCRRVAELLDVLGWEYTPLRDLKALPTDPNSIWIQSFATEEIVERTSEAWLTHPFTRIVAEMAGYKLPEESEAGPRQAERWSRYLSVFEENDRPMSSAGLAKAAMVPKDTVRDDLLMFSKTGLITKYGTGQRCRWAPAAWDLPDPKTPPLIVEPVKAPFNVYDELERFLKRYTEVTNTHLDQLFNQQVARLVLDRLMVEHRWSRSAVRADGLTIWYAPSHPLWQERPHTYDRYRTLGLQEIPAKRKLTDDERRLLAAETPDDEITIETAVEKKRKTVIGWSKRHGKILRALRQSQAWTAETAAEGICSRAYLCQVERAAMRPSETLLVRLASRYGVNVEDLREANKKVLEPEPEPEPEKPRPKPEIKLLLPEVPPTLRQGVLESLKGNGLKSGSQISQEMGVSLTKVRGALAVLLADNEITEIRSGAKRVHYVAAE